MDWIAKLKFDIDFISFLSIFIPSITGLILYTRILETAKILVIFIWVTALIEVTAAIFYYKGWNNLFAFHLHTYFEFILLSLVFQKLIHARELKQLINGTIVVFMVFSVINTFLLEDITGFNAIHRHVEGFILTIFILLYLLQNSKYKESFKENPFLLLAYALLIYFNGNLFLFIYAKQVLTTGTGEMWMIHGLLNILLNIAFTAVIIGSRIMIKRIQNKFWKMGFIKVAIDLLNASFNKAEKFIEFALTVKGVRPNTFNNASMDNFGKKENRKRPDKKNQNPSLKFHQNAPYLHLEWTKWTNKSNVVRPKMLLWNRKTNHIWLKSATSKIIWAFFFDFSQNVWWSKPT